jgi:hypothetical protein
MVSEAIAAAAERAVLRGSGIRLPPERAPAPGRAMRKPAMQSARDG